MRQLESAEIGNGLQGVKDFRVPFSSSGQRHFKRKLHNNIIKDKGKGIGNITLTGKGEMKGKGRRQII